MKDRMKDTVKMSTHRKVLERLRVAQALLAAEERHHEHTRQAWLAERIEVRRMYERATYLYGVALTLGATPADLAGRNAEIVIGPPLPPEANTGLPQNTRGTT